MDPHGLAILRHVQTGGEQWFRFFYQGASQPGLTLCSRMYLEPSGPQMEVIRRAVEMCRGRVLDVGAGGGFAALALQQLDMDVTAVDLSAHCVEAMQTLGVKRCLQADIRELSAERYDTLLLLDSVLAAGGTLEGVAALLRHLRSLLDDGGQVLVHEGTGMAGIRVQEWCGHFEYEHYVGDTFQWCNVSRERLCELAQGAGLRTEFPDEDDIDGRYLARLVAG